MKRKLSEIPKEIRQPYIRLEAERRIYNKINEKYKYMKELKRI